MSGTERTATGDGPTDDRNATPDRTAVEDGNNDADREPPPDGSAAEPARRDDSAATNHTGLTPDSIPID